MIGTQLEEAGWVQGSFVKNEDIASLFREISRPIEAGLSLILASQSCDIANNNVNMEPYVEASISREINSINGSYSYNKNPRIIHIEVMNKEGDENINIETFIEIKGFEKIFIPKEYFIGLSPDGNKVLESKTLHGYVAWLAARYSRPALPTEFNNRIKSADPKDKIRGKVKKGSESLIGIYVEINPDREIKEDESYRVNLLGLLPARFSEDATKANNIIQSYKKLLEDAGMEVTESLLTEDKVSLAMIKRFKRFYYDDISFRENKLVPVEVENIL